MHFIIVQHLDIEPAAIIANVIEAAGHQCSCIDLEHGDKLPTKANDFDGIIVMGGPQSANDQDDVMQTELAWIKTAINANTPMLGVCLGAQIMAKAAGAEITPSPLRELGWFPIFHTASTTDDALFKSMADGLSVFQWHGETFSLTESMTLLATHPDVPAQAFRLGNAQYGLQFHIEIDASIIEQWIAYGESERHHLGEKSIQQLHQDTQLCLNPMQQFCRQMVKAWLDLL